jgi:hypothetical protein
MNHFLRKIDSNGLFIEDCFWDDGAYPETVGVPKMTAGSPAVPAVEYQAAVEAAMGVEAKREVLAVAAVPEVLPVHETDAQGNLIWTTEPVAAFAGNPIPADMIATPVPDGFVHPKWDSAQWVEGKTANEMTAIAKVRQQVTTQRQIDALETQVTSRRIREAILSGDTRFVKSIDDQIKTLRGTP